MTNQHISFKYEFVSWGVVNNLQIKMSHVFDYRRKKEENGWNLSNECMWLGGNKILSPSRPTCTRIYLFINRPLCWQKDHQMANGTKIKTPLLPHHCQLGFNVLLVFNSKTGNALSLSHFISNCFEKKKLYNSFGKMKTILLWF